MKLRRGELDLLAQQPVLDKQKRRSNLTTGSLQSIYQEQIALFRRLDFPKAKVPQSITIVQTSTTEYVYRERGSEVLISVDGEAFGAFRQNKFYHPGKVDVVAELEPQRDDRTVHVEHGSHTIGILLRAGTSRLAAPRAFEFVDCDSDDERMLLETLSFLFLLTENMPAN